MREENNKDIIAQSVRAKGYRRSPKGGGTSEKERPKLNLERKAQKKFGG